MANDETSRRTWIVEIDDVEAQGGRYFGFGQTEKDVEGQSLRGSWLVPDNDDADGEGFSVRGLRQTEDGKYLLEIDTAQDMTGDSYKYGLAQTEGEVEAEGGRFNGVVRFIRPSVDDTEGHGGRYSG